MFSNIPHAHFPFDESPWITHFKDADQANLRARTHAAEGADSAGHDTFARHIMNSPNGTNPFQTYQGPFGEGQVGQQVVPNQPPHLYQEYFGNHAQPGGVPGMGQFANPATKPIPGAAPKVPGAPGIIPSPGSNY